MGPYLFTELPSVVYESTWPYKNKNQIRGIYCEDLVIHRYESKGYRLRARRWKTPFAEIDLVFDNPKNPMSMILVEVKSSSNRHFISFRVKKSQRERLRRAYLWMCKSKRQLEFHLAVVHSPDNRISIFPRFLEEP